MGYLRNHDAATGWRRQFGSLFIAGLGIGWHAAETGGQRSGRGGGARTQYADPGYEPQR